ncbi:MAG: ABC transporter ATP-binding protein [Clostridia bacterium]|nr:ABC transporter ATP-binding protein [Clostridia bacterium]
MKKESTIRKVLSYIGRYKLLLPVSILLAIATVALTLYVPVLIGDAITVIEGMVRGGGEAVNEGAFTELGNIFALAVLLILITAATQWLMSMINNRIAYHVAKDVRRDAFNKIEKLPLSYLDTHPHGDILSRTVNDTEQFSEGLLLGFTQLFTGIVTILGTLVLLFVLCWPVALVVLLLTPLSLFFSRFIARRTFNTFREQSGAKGAQTALIDEMIGNEKIVKAFGYEGRARERFDEANSRLGRISLKAIFSSSIVNPATRFINNVVYAVVALVGALLIINPIGGAEAITVGTLSVLLAYANQYTKPFNEISGVITEFQNALASADRVFDLIEAEEEISDEGNKTLENATGSVSLSEVSFRYVDDKPLIEGLNLSTKPGQRIAIVGPTGCGKTTLINLLMRFYDVKGGSIKVDGEDVRALTRRSLRQGFGMVLQDTWLKDGTVRENIALARPDATDEDIKRASKAAHAHSFIKRLPKGYDTVIGESVGGLSQGQRQLLSIARIMLTLPPMLILDEATSSIDTRTEMKIQDAFSEMMKGRTSFIVAHRLSTVKEADVILVMKAGAIVEQGSHEELLARHGFYYELYNSQFAH